MTVDEAVALAHAKARTIFEASLKRLRDDITAAGFDDEYVEEAVAAARAFGEASMAEQMAGIRRQLCEPDAPTGRLQ